MVLCLILKKELGAIQLLGTRNHTRISECISQVGSLVCLVLQPGGAYT